MKVVFLILLAVIMPFSVVEAGDTSMNERAQALMSALKIKPGSEKELPNRKQGALSMQKFKVAGDLAISHKTMGKADPNRASNGLVSSDRLVFSNQEGKAKVVGKVKYASSTKAAQFALFEELARNSLPLEILIRRYKIDTKGPGDLCVVGVLPGKEKGTFIVDESRMHFIRGNVVVSIRSVDVGGKVQDIARMMDEKLVAE